jgi:hypothetical protein
MTKTSTCLIAAAFFFLLLSCAGINFPAGETREIKSVTAEVIAGATTDGEKIERIFLFVRDEIAFNWIYPQDITTTEVLSNGFGVCMQKANLFSAMVREAGFKTRFRFEFVRKQALEDFLPAYAYKNWMDLFPHTVTEVLIDGTWVSFDPSFDSELYDICLRKGINFARYPEISAAYSNEFSLQGMKGTQEFWLDPDHEPFYGEDLSPLMEWDKTHVPAIKRLLKAGIFRDARRIMNRLREA